jgi:uncharacterized repeat protein (TIGR03803 family)
MTVALSPRAVTALASLLAPSLAGAASLKPVYQFAANAAGAYPSGAGPSAEVIEAPDGSYFTTTQYGGSTACFSGYNGCGTVVHLVGNHASVIFTFPYNSGSNPAAPDGALPVAGLVQGPDGALYGATATGGSGEYGTLFKLIPGAGSSWTIQVLHAFTAGNECNAPIDGADPEGRLAFGPDGMLYGTTAEGGCVIDGTGGDRGPYNNQGTLFRVATDGTGYANLYNFNGSWDYTQGITPDAANPAAGLTLAPNGLFYGTSQYGGTADWGTVFQYDPVANVVTVLHSFSGASPDGGFPFGSLTLDTLGNFWSTTYAADNGDDPTAGGTVFRMAPSSPNTVTSYPFSSLASQPYTLPKAGVIEAANGKFYGTAGSGSFYEITKAGTFTELGIFPSTLTTTAPIASPLQSSNGSIYVTASDGGPVNAEDYTDRGGVFRYSVGHTGPKPLLTWFLPTNAAVGASVVLGGANFVGASRVVFHGTSASSAFAVNASGFITATVPAGATTGPVAVTTPAGTVTSAVSFVVP